MQTVSRSCFDASGSDGYHEVGDRLHRARRVKVVLERLVDVDLRRFDRRVQRLLRKQTANQQ